MAHLKDTIKDVLKQKKLADEQPIIVVVDFTLVVGMDSSAAHAVAKLKKILHRLLHVEVSIFVTGSDRGGFPCEYALSEALSPDNEDAASETSEEFDEVATGRDSIYPAQVSNATMPTAPRTTPVQPRSNWTHHSDCRVCETLDDALRFAEDLLIIREDSSLEISSNYNELEDFAAVNLTMEEERHFGQKFLKELLPASNRVDEIVEEMWSAMKRQQYKYHEVVWEFGMESDSMKLLVCGELISIIEDTGASEIVRRANTVGELGLVHGTKRLTTLLCNSEEAVLYSLDRVEFERLKEEQPHVAMAVDAVAIRYLAHRVQHVSNRYFHTTLPV